jgi:FKBP-type peptidyl-prolyl cis-trans isomerase
VTGVQTCALPICVKYLKHGDKALLLIPSHLAHGLLGDFKKIPPQMPIIYDVEIY